LTTSTEEGNFDARIIVDISDDSFKVTHTANLDLEQVYLIFAAALDYMDAMGENLEPPKFLN
jgi:hypothetical protein